MYTNWPLTETSDERIKGTSQWVITFTRGMTHGVPGSLKADTARTLNATSFKGDFTVKSFWYLSPHCHEIFTTRCMVWLWHQIWLCAMNELSWVFGCFSATSASHKNGQMSYGRGVSIEPKLLIVQIYTLHTCFISRFPMKDWPIWTFMSSRS